MVAMIEAVTVEEGEIQEELTDVKVAEAEVQIDALVVAQAVEPNEVAEPVDQEETVKKLKTQTLRLQKK